MLLSCAYHQKSFFFMKYKQYVKLPLKLNIPSLVCFKKYITIFFKSIKCFAFSKKHIFNMVKVSLFKNVSKCYEIFKINICGSATLYDLIFVTNLTTLNLTARLFLTASNENNIQFIKKMIHYLSRSFK